MTKPMQVGYFQFNPIFGEIKKNIGHVEHSLSSVSADLIVLPELFSTGYQFTSKKEVRDLSEPVPDGYTSQHLIHMAKKNNFYIVAGLCERDGKQVYNSAILVGPGGFLGSYRKIHLFHEETLWFSPGNRGFEVHSLGTVRIGIMVCFDWIFPEAARTLALKGADIICHPSNLVLPYCPDAMVTRAIENRVFTITANRTGKEKRGRKHQLAYIGQSEIVSPSGEILVRAPKSRDDLQIANINPLEARKKQINPFNHLLKDRRPRFYSSPTKQ